MADNEDGSENEPEIEFTDEEDNEYGIDGMQNVLKELHFIANFKK